MQFGNWRVTESNIEWVGGGGSAFTIPMNELNATRHDPINKTIFYDWILIATNEEWLSQNDLFDLNYAFVFAVAKAGLDFNFEIFDNTLEEQYDLFDEEDNENFEL